MASVGIIILSTFPSEESIANVANKVVERRLCACVNFTRVRSIYCWRGKLEDQQEFIALFKTTPRSARKLAAEIARLHPYKVPEIVELKMGGVSNPYLSWLVDSTNGIPKKRHDAAKR